MNQFRYLGRVVDEDDNDVYAASRQLSRAKAKWGRIGNVVRAEGASPQPHDGLLLQNDSSGRVTMRF